MRLLKLSCATAVGALLCMLLVAPSTAVASMRSDGSIGIHPGTNPVEIGATGAGSWRLWDTGTAWRDIETSRGVYNWGTLDSWVSRANAVGIADIMYVFGTTPIWAVDPSATTYQESTSHGWRGSGSAKPPRLSDYQSFVQALVDRYRGRITSYEVWNEANLKPYWVGTPARMAELTKIAFDVINNPQTGDPSAQVLAASTTVRGTKFSGFYPKYLKELKKRRWPIDAYTGHFYPDRTAKPYKRILLFKKFRFALKRAKAAKRPIWDTEVNYGLRGYEVPQSKIAAYVGQSFLESRKQKIARTYWYIWGPEIVYEGTPLLGVTIKSGTTGADAFAQISTWLSDTAMSKCLTKSRLNYCRFDKADARQTIAWTHFGTAKIRVPTFATTACTLNGKCKSVRPKSLIVVGMTPVKFSTE